MIAPTKVGMVFLLFVCCVMTLWTAFGAFVNATNGRFALAAFWALLAMWSNRHANECASLLREHWSDLK